MSAMHYSPQKSFKLPSTQTQIAYADPVSCTGAPKYFLIVARSTFQSHCRALAMGRDIFSHFNLCFAQPPIS